MQIFKVTALLIVIVFFSDAIAQKSDSKLTTEVAPNNKYGEGGTVTTVSDDKFQVISQTWKDKDGKVREMYQVNSLSHQVWAFFTAEVQDLLKPREILVYEPETKNFITTKGNNDYIIDDVSGSQVRQWIEEVETQFAKDGTIVRPWDPDFKPDKLEQPQMPPTEVFNKPKESKTESKSEEPKKEQPKKEDPPKTDKTGTGDSGNTASTTSTYTAPGYKVEIKTDYGLTSPIFTTPYGEFKINIPGDLQPGDPFSGTVWLDPLGKNEAERTSNTRELFNHSFQLSPNNEVRLKWKDPAEAPLNLRPYTSGMHRTSLVYGTLELFDEGESVGRIQLPTVFGNAPQPTHFTIPTGAQQGSIFSIPGPFDGIVSETDYVEIGGQRIPIISESPRSRVVWDRSTFIGPSNIKIGESGQTYQCPFHNVSVKMSAPNLNLKRGETTLMTVVVSGLASLKQDVPFELVNQSSAVVSMAGGNQQSTIIHAETAAHATDLKADGTYTTTRTLTGITPGGFTITGTVRWRDTCKPPMEVMQVPKKPSAAIATLQ